MNAFERHGIKHLSASSLGLYRDQPAAWVCRYLLRVKDEAGPSAWRGSATEAGAKGKTWRRCSEIQASG